MRFQILPVLITICLLFHLANVSNADYEYDYFSDRLSREYRDAGDLEYICFLYQSELSI